MNPTLQIILESIFVIIALLAMGFFKLKEEISLDIIKLITEAEEKPISGSEKMQWLVSTLYSSIFPIAKTYFTKERIQKLAQSIFDNVRKYANKYHDNNF